MGSNWESWKIYYFSGFKNAKVKCLVLTNCANIDLPVLIKHIYLCCFTPERAMVKCDALFSLGGFCVVSTRYHSEILYCSQPFLENDVTHTKTCGKRKERCISVFIQFEHCKPLWASFLALLGAVETINGQTQGVTCVFQWFKSSVPNFLYIVTWQQRSRAVWSYFLENHRVT